MAACQKNCQIFLGGEEMGTRSRIGKLDGTSADAQRRSLEQGLGGRWPDRNEAFPCLSFTSATASQQSVTHFAFTL
jgi:hypothetical protein